MKTASVLLLSSLLFFSIIASIPSVKALGPTNTTWGENWVEGNWTSYVSVCTITAGQPWTDNSDDTFWVNNTGSTTYLINGENTFTISPTCSTTDLGFHAANGIGGKVEYPFTRWSAYFTYQVVVQDNVNFNLIVLKNGHILQNISTIFVGFQFNGVSMSPNGEFIMVQGFVNSGGFNSQFQLFKAVGSLAPFDEDPFFSYSVSCGTPAPGDAPTITGTSNGAPFSAKMSTTPQNLVLDNGTAWSVSNPWFSNFQFFHPNHSSGTINGSSIIITYSSCGSTCSSTDPFQLFLAGCWWGTWYFTTFNVMGNFGAGFTFAAIAIALYLKTENPMTPLVVFLISGGIFVGILPVLFLPIGAMFLVIGVAGGLYQILRER